MKQVAIATMTWVRTPAEETLLRQSLTSLATHGLPVAVADSESDFGFLQFLRGLPQFHVTRPDGIGLVAQITASLKAAAHSGYHFVLYTEPDKLFFFEHRLADFLDAASHHADAGVILASRSSESFQTYPPMQRYTEGVVNHLCGQLIGVECDVSYGPFLVGTSILPVVETLEPTLGWGWRHALFRWTHQQGRPLVPLVGDYPCPEDQRAEDDEERTHRMGQLSQNILGLIR